MFRFKSIISFLLIFAVIFSLFGCGGGDNESSATDTKTVYVIQYADDTGTHTINVKNGELYSLESLPSKTGYEFLGLFDAESGGTQYVSASGTSLAAFTDGKNIVLYPQFKAKEYTLVLDYQGAAVTGVRSMQVSYNSLINNLPSNLTLENKNFVGWYTAPNKGGEQVFDEYGAIPMKNIVNDEIFEITDSTKTLYLYAGFKGEEFTVTFYYDGISTPEEVKVEYGTYIADVQTETRVDGKAVIVWSKTRNDTNKENAFTGKVTGEMVLYSAEFAPVIDFDTNGGNKVNSVIKRAGEAVILPTPVKKNYNFGGWKTSGGAAYTFTTMPSTSIKLFAEWQAIITFNTNGGSAVAEISKKAGASITLPETEKDGYMFAGWYEANGNKYENTSMPAASIKLNAKYYKTLTEKFNWDDEQYTNGGYSFATSESFYIRYKTVLSDSLYKNIRSVSQLIITIKYEIKVQSSKYTNKNNNYYKFGVNFNGEQSTYYWSNQVSDETLKLDYTKSQMTFNINNPIIESQTMRFAFYASTKDWYSDHFVRNIELIISLPDMSRLY